MFSNRDLKRMIVPLFLEQLLMALVGIADVFVIGYVGEAAVSGVPLVHTMVIPGVETLNAAFFAARGMSFFARSPAEAARYADRLVFDAYTRGRMLEAQHAQIPSDGAQRIADIVLRGLQG